MKILRTYIKIPPAAGGMEYHIKELTLQQRLQNNEVTLAFNEGQATSNTDIKVFGLIKLNEKLKSSLAIFLFNIGLVVVLLFTKNNKFHAIHIHGDWHSMLFAPVLKFITKAKLIIYSNHGFIEPQKRATKWLVLLLKKYSNLNFCTGYHSYKLFKNSGVNNVVFQHSGIRNVFIKKSLRQPKTIDNVNKIKVVCVANYTEVKNLGLVLKIAEQMPTLNFYLIGEGPLRSVLEKTINDKNLKNVYLEGKKNDEELSAYYNNAHVFLLTSLKEGFPTSILEAMYFGLPIISSNAGDIEAIVEENINGNVIDNFDANQFTAKINNLLANASLYQQISNNNINKSEDFVWEKCAANITNAMVKQYETV